MLLPARFNTRNSVSVTKPSMRLMRLECRSRTSRCARRSSPSS
jgi:hypothetical protein